MNQESIEVLGLQLPTIIRVLAPQRAIKVIRVMATPETIKLVS